MRGENMAKNRPKCCQISDTFVAITPGKMQSWLWKSLEDLGNFFLLLCGHADSLY